MLKLRSSLQRQTDLPFLCSAVARGASGRVYLGCNIELPNLPLNACIHAEQCLVTNLLLHGESSAETLAVSAAPCGHCRQFLAELVCAVRACAQPCCAVRPACRHD